MQESIRREVSQNARLASLGEDRLGEIRSCALCPVKNRVADHGTHKLRALELRVAEVSFKQSTRREVCTCAQRP